MNVDWRLRINKASQFFHRLPFAGFGKLDRLLDFAGNFRLHAGPIFCLPDILLFQAFDEIEDLASARPDLLVDSVNLESLLSALDI